jgi:protein required for attachment to host cells
MNKTLFVVAHRGGARLLTQRGQKIESVEEIDHPEGRMRDQDRDSDRPGRTHNSSGMRHALPAQESAHDHIAADFARMIARELRARRNAGAYADVVLVAGPEFLGLLRESLDNATAKLVAGTVTKDLSWVETRDLHEHLRAI